MFLKKINNLPSNFLEKALHWASYFDTFIYLTSNDITYPFSPFPKVLAIGREFNIDFSNKEVFQTLEDYTKTHKNWLFGHFTYDLKNEIEHLKSQNKDYLGFPLANFFQPLYLLHFSDNEVTINVLSQSQQSPQQIFSSISNQKIEAYPKIEDVHFQALTSKDEYLANVEKIKQHIIEGDIYELNYCIQFFSQNSVIEPINVFLKLNQISPMPFAALYKLGKKWLICASPERFLKKQSSLLISQPIKGTIKRGENKNEDDFLANQLKTSEKERAENMMIVDLVRNDLAKSCKVGTVKVPEMLEVYRFKTIQQMISTVQGEIKPQISFIQAIKNAFPMGSMTGAPKIKAMELIEHYENIKRGLFSGSVGFITPEGDFDFNVVIRSLFYDCDNQCLSYLVGSAITYDSVPEKEYEECMLKAQVLKKVLENDK
ncbi:MAG: anthranilate synthase component I family protein [Flammeovirgaceae bacterium]